MSEELPTFPFAREPRKRGRKPKKDAVPNLDSSLFPGLQQFSSSFSSLSSLASLSSSLKPLKSPPLSTLEKVGLSSPGFPAVLPPFSPLLKSLPPPSIPGASAAQYFDLKALNPPVGLTFQLPSSFSLQVLAVPPVKSQENLDQEKEKEKEEEQKEGKQENLKEEKEKELPIQPLPSTQADQLPNLSNQLPPQSRFLSQLPGLPLPLPRLQSLSSLDDLDDKNNNHQKEKTPTNTTTIPQTLKRKKSDAGSKPGPKVKKMKLDLIGEIGMQEIKLADEQKRQKRKEKNKIAARKCRAKKQAEIEFLNIQVKLQNELIQKLYADQQEAVEIFQTLIQFKPDKSERDNPLGFLGAVEAQNPEAIKDLEKKIENFVTQSMVETQQRQQQIVQQLSNYRRLFSSAMSPNGDDDEDADGDGDEDDGDDGEDDEGIEENKEKEKERIQGLSHENSSLSLSYLSHQAAEILEKEQNKANN